MAEQGQVFLGKKSAWDNWKQAPAPTTSTPITVSRAGNPYFADYQPQNGSVLSIFDDLSVVVNSHRCQFAEVAVDYSVIGFHTDSSVDPLHIDPALSQSPRDRLSACSLSVSSTGLEANDTVWLASALTSSMRQNMRALLSGNFMKLQWNQYPGERAMPAGIKYPGDTIQTSFANSHPVAVGTNAIDALFGWLRSTASSDSFANDAIRSNLNKIQTLVLDINDDIDSQLQSDDLLATNNFVPCDQGIFWHFEDSDSDQKLPTEDEIAALRDLNALQVQLNAMLRDQKRLKEKLFHTWWTYMATRGKSGRNLPTQESVSYQVWELYHSIQSNGDGAPGSDMAYKMNQVENAKGDLKLKAGIEPRFYTQRDPTVLVAGLSSKWPTPSADDKLPVRLDSQNKQIWNTTSRLNSPLPNLPINLANTFSQHLQPSLVTPTVNLLQAAVNDRNDYRSGTTAVTSPYYNNGDRWTGDNGWFPLFIEW